MPLLPFDPDRVRPEYGIALQRFLPADGLPIPFGASRCTVAPNRGTTPHRHSEGEVFFIASGNGRVAISGESDTTVKAGDLVFIPPQAEHTLWNEAADSELVFFSTWWEPQASAPLAPISVPAARTLILAAPPTPNGNLHLGHLAGPYLAADAYARHLRMQGKQAFYATGSDDHQSYVATKAESEGVPPATVARKYAASARATLEAAGVAIAHFWQASQDADYQAFVKAFVDQLARSGALALREGTALYCEACELYLHEARVAGLCPHCLERTSGNGCEACGRLNVCTDLIDPTCNRCGKPPKLRPVEHLVFALEPYRDRLRQAHEQMAMPQALRELLQRWLAEPLPDLTASYHATWGISVEGPMVESSVVEGPVLEGQVLFAWVEMAAAYLHAAEAIAGDVGAFWRQPDAAVALFFGFDNAYYYGIVVLALLLAFDADIQLPLTLQSNAFYQLGGEKFSTSRRHAIWADEALAHASPDLWRFVLASDRPENGQTSFEWPLVRGRVRRDLVEGVDAWLARLATEPASSSPSTLSPGPGSPEARTRSPLPESALRRRLDHLAIEIQACYQPATFSLRRASRLLAEWVELAADFGPMESESARTVLEGFARAAYPLMPDLGGKILRSLGAPDAELPTWAAHDQHAPGHWPPRALAERTFARDLAGIDALSGLEALAGGLLHTGSFSA